jgi:hypothetical protein
MLATRPDSSTRLWQQAWKMFHVATDLQQSRALAVVVVAMVVVVVVVTISTKASTDDINRVNSSCRSSSCISESHWGWHSCSTSIVKNIVAMSIGITCWGCADSLQREDEVSKDTFSSAMNSFCSVSQSVSQSKVDMSGGSRSRSKGTKKSQKEKKSQSERQRVRKRGQCRTV